MEHLPTLTAPIPVPLTRILAEPLPPCEQACVEALFYAIARDGLREPLTLQRTEAGYVLIQGRRRLAALSLLHLLRGDTTRARIPAFVRDGAALARPLAGV